MVQYAAYNHSSCHLSSNQSLVFSSFLYTFIIIIIMHLLCPNLVSGSWILRWTLLCLAVVVSMMGTTVAMLYDYHNSHNNHRPAVVRGHLGNHHRVHLHGPTTVVRSAYKNVETIKTSVQEYDGGSSRSLDDITYFFIACCCSTEKRLFVVFEFEQFRCLLY